MIVNSYVYAVGGYDSDAQAFFTAAGITDTGQKDAIDALVVGLKADGLWSKCTAIYPFVGGSSSSHAVNLKSPGTYDLTYTGTLTHSSTGMLPDGTTGYADTGLVPSSALTGSDTHLGFYSRTSNTNNKTDMGCFTGVNYHSMALCCYYSFAGKTALSYAYDGGASLDMAGLTSTESTDSQGFFVSSRTSASSHYMYKAATAGTQVTNLTGNFPSITDTVKIGAASHNGMVPSSTFYGNRECAFASIGSGLTGSDVTALTSRVQAYQTSLSRQV